MTESLMETARSIKDIVQNINFRENEVLEDLADESSRLMGADVVILDKNGRLLACTNDERSDVFFGFKSVGGQLFIENQLNEQLKNIYETKENLSLKGYYIKNPAVAEKYSAVVLPTINNGERNGTVLLFKNGSFGEKDIVYTEFLASLVSVIIYYAQNAEEKNASAKEEIVRSAMSTLSYSELEAIVYILRELNSSEGKLVASHVADKVGITRSVIVNAIRKLESAGVIESRSLGMKGTYIKVLNEKLFDELKAYEE